MLEMEQIGILMLLSRQADSLDERYTCLEGNRKPFIMGGNSVSPNLI